MSITVCQFSTSNVPYLKYTVEINKLYCEKMGYNYYVELDDSKIMKALEGRSITWYKPHLIREVMEKYSESDYIMFLDIDAVFANHDHYIEEFTSNPLSKIIMTKDHGPSLVNAGVIILQNSMVTYSLMKKWWDLGEKYPEYKTGLWHDQTCLKYLYDELEDKSIFEIIENNILNSRVYNSKCFVFHAFSYGTLPYRTIDTVYNNIFGIKGDTPMTLSQIAKKYPTDKDFSHNYFDAVYEKYFFPIKDKVKNLCEVGVGGFWGDVGWVPGNSLRVWEEYFSNANVLGLDINSYDLKNEGRITVDWIDQSKRDLVDSYSKKMAQQDIILDDGSHNMHDQQITFSSFFRNLVEGGIFVIEDLHSSIEVKIPEKRDLWGWGDPNVITTLEMLEHFQNTGKIKSDYLTEEEKKYLEDNIESVEIFTVGPTSITSIIKKKC